MRPIKLTVSAFGPYVKETILELDKLGDNGLYLITGDTGAGKTTIFDAISFALFGEASGENRESKSFRSKYADDDTKTFVELEFLYNGKKYIVNRIPEYTRKKKSGDGYTKQSADAWLEIEGSESLITKYSDVTKKIIEILGVDRKQYAQISMIAQGEFLKLLLADTKERQPIFRDIFKTMNFAILQEKIKQESINLEKEKNIFLQSINQYIAGIVCKKDTVEEIEIEKAKSNQMQTSDVILLIEKLIAQDNQEEKEATKIIKEFDDKINSLSTRLGKSQEIQKTKIALEKAVISKEESTQQLGVSLKSLEEEKAKEEEKKNLAEKITIAKDKLDGYNEREKLANDNEKSQETLSKKKIELEEKSLANKKLEENIKNRKLELESLKNCHADEQKFLSEKEKTNDNINRCDALEKTLQNFTALKVALKNTQSEYEFARNDATKKTSFYNDSYNAYLDEQAGILAQNLKENIPCPVCGSKNHPLKAVITENAPTKQELDTMKIDSDKAMALASKKSELSASKQKELELVENQLLSNGKELIVDFDLNLAKEQIYRFETSLNEKLNEVNEKLNTAQTNIEKCKKIESAIPLGEEKVKRVDNEITQLKVEIAKLEEEIKSNISTIEKLSKNLEFNTKQQAIENINIFEQQLNSMQKSLEKAQKSYDDSKAQFDKIEGEISGYKEQLKDCVLEDIEKLENEIDILKNQKSVESNNANNISNRIKINSSILENINKQSKKLIECEGKFQWVNALSKTANGDIKGKEKVTLETYVQMNYFDRIIRKANTRLMAMSSGQYELIRRNSGDKHNSKSGLELNVIDHYNGSERDVKSLSGGESFTASLSLALGLSDEIQSSAGGIKIDTMYVDEGFGTLDEETLSMAIKTLSALGDGKRLVGIISHVGELKDKIDKKIIVTKNKSGGSSVELIT